MQILFDVNFLLDMTVFLERNEDPRLESLYIDFFFFASIPFFIKIINCGDLTRQRKRFLGFHG